MRLVSRVSTYIQTVERIEARGSEASIAAQMLERFEIFEINAISIADVNTFIRNKFTSLRVGFNLRVVPEILKRERL